MVVRLGLGVRLIVESEGSYAMRCLVCGVVPSCGVASVRTACMWEWIRRTGGAAAVLLFFF